MPLVLDTPHGPSRGTPEGAATIEIALLNNLGDAGMESAERQIVELLSEVAGSALVRLRFFSLPQIPRGRHARARLAEHYTEFADLMQSRVDGLIVTGAEPRTDRLPDEPFWHGLSAVIDWAEHNTRSTIWSCLAAHAAVLHLDGIVRRPLPAKCSGVFPVERASDHPLLDGTRVPLLVTHSRYNDLDETELVASGYDILTRSDSIGVDTFAKQWKSLFVYLQGHPEYDSDGLRREYRRDVLRYLRGTAPIYPDMPRNYFTPELAASLEDFAVEARRDPRTGRPFPLNDRATRLKPWRRAFALTLYGNWLRLLATTASDRVA